MHEGIEQRNTLIEERTSDYGRWKTTFEYNLEACFWDLFVKAAGASRDDETSDEAASSFTVQRAVGSVQTDAPTEKGS